MNTNMVDLSRLSNTEAEQSILGSIFIDNEALAKCDKLTAQSFFFFPHRLIYQAMVDMAANNQPIDVVTLEAVLKAREQNDAAGGLSYLIDLHTQTPSAANIEQYVNIVADCYAERQMANVAEQIASLASERTGRSVADRQAEAVQLLHQVADVAAGTNEEKSYSQAIQAALDRMEQIGNLPAGALLGFTTGLRQLDDATVGLRRGDLTVIGARPSMGKSVLAENIARANAKLGYSVHFQSYEMPASDLVIRGAAAEQGIDFGNLRKARLTQQELDAFNVYLKRAENWKFAIDTEMVGIDKLAARCRAKKNRHGVGLDLLAVDHLHLMPLANPNNKVSELDDITAKLKRLAMELDIHVVLVAQLNRGVEMRQDKRPTMADLRESGGIEQNANLVILPYRHAYYYEDANPNEAELIIAKNRDGERGTLYVGWEGNHQRFINHAREWNAPKKPVQQQADPCSI